MLLATNALRASKNNFFATCKPSHKDFWKVVNSLNGSVSSIPIHCKNRWVVFNHRVVILVGWLMLVTEAYCIKQAGGSFLLVSSSFPYFRMRKEEETTKKLVII